MSSEPWGLATVAAVVGPLRDWISGTGARPAAEPLEVLLGKVVDSAEATGRDLQDRPELDPDLRDPIEGCLEAYALLREGLEICREAVACDDPRAAHAGLSSLEAGARELEQHDLAVREWLEAPLPRCPRCGSAGPEAGCPACGLDRLIPDAEAAQRSSWETATLAPDFLAVYEAYRALQLGEGPLAGVLGSLVPLERRMVGTACLAQKEVPELESAARLCLEGIERLRRVTSTRAMRDVHQGWRDIFEAGLQVQDLLPELLQAAGKEPPNRDPQDSVFLRGD